MQKVTKNILGDNFNLTGWLFARSVIILLEVMSTEKRLIQSSKYPIQID